MTNKAVVTITDDDILEWSVPSRHFRSNKIRFWKIEGNFDFYGENGKLFSSNRVCCERNTDGYEDEIFVSGDISGHTDKGKNVNKIICNNAEIHFGKMTTQNQVSFLGIKLEKKR